MNVGLPRDDKRSHSLCLHSRKSAVIVAQVSRVDDLQSQVEGVSRCSHNGQILLRGRHRRVLKKRDSREPRYELFEQVQLFREQNRR